MEVRCGNCHKLFRVSDDKISGKGIKFVCTRCGVYVRITIEDFSTYTLSKSAVSVLDLFEEKKPSQATSEIGIIVEQTAEAATTPARMTPEKEATEPTMEITAGEDFLKSPISDFLDEKKGPATVDRSPFEEPASQASPLPEREPESPAQTESQSEKSDIAQSEQAKIPEPEPGMTPTLAVEEDAHHAFEQQPEPPEQETETLTMQVAVPEGEPGIAAAGETIDAVQPEPQLKPDPEKGKEPVAAAEPEPVVALAVEKTEEAQLEPEQQPVSQREQKTEMAVEPAAAPERGPVSTSPSETPGTDQDKQKPESETNAAVMPAAVAEPDIRSEMKTAAIPSASHQPAQNTPRYQTGSQPVRPTKPAVPAAQALKKESSHRLSPASSPVIGASPTESHRSGNKAMITGVAVIILVLAGFGAYMFLRSPVPSSSNAALHMISTEGLRITNAAGSLEPNGDLLISGVVENSTDKPQPAWLVVVDVYDAKGTVINKIKLLNGKQLYSQSDYAILAKRGANVQEMKANALQEQGTVIPPKDKVTFEIRYLEPPAGIASFSATLQPFDPARLSKEPEDQTK
jgi:predicted Zn finger-like uncharacterized protein